MLKQIFAVLYEIYIAKQIKKCLNYASFKWLGLISWLIVHYLDMLQCTLYEQKLRQITYS